MLKICEGHIYPVTGNEEESFIIFNQVVTGIMKMNNICYYLIILPLIMWEKTFADIIMWASFAFEIINGLGLNLVNTKS